MRRLWAPRWIARHVLMIVLVVGFLALGWWQVGRAASGNALSYGYAVEWPVFAAFVIYVWLRWIRDELRSEQGSKQGSEQESKQGSAAATEQVSPVPTGPGPAVVTSTRPTEVAGSGGAAAAAGPAAGAEPGAGRARTLQLLRQQRSAAYADADDDLADYNRYLAWLNANPDARPQDYPG